MGHNECSCMKHLIKKDLSACVAYISVDQSCDIISNGGSWSILGLNSKMIRCVGGLGVTRTPSLARDGDSR